MTLEDFEGKNTCIGIPIILSLTQRNRLHILVTVGAENVIYQGQELGQLVLSLIHFVSETGGKSNL